LTEEKAKEFESFDNIELIVIPKFTLAAGKRLPRAHNGKREEFGLARICPLFCHKCLQLFTSVLVSELTWLVLIGHATFIQRRR